MTDEERLELEQFTSRVHDEMRRYYEQESATIGARFAVRYPLPPFPWCKWERVHELFASASMGRQWLRW